MEELMQAVYEAFLVGVREGKLYPDVDAEILLEDFKNRNGFKD
jgi:hypothetical protein